MTHAKDEVLKLAAEFDKRFTSMNGIDLPERVSVPRDEWRALHEAIRQALAAQQEPVESEILQAITDPENQPSQFGTVTLEYHFEKIKKWEELFERMSNKVLAQPAPVQEPAGHYAGNHKVRLYCDVPVGTRLYTTPPAAQRQWVGLTDDEMYLNCPNWLSQEQCKVWVAQIETKLKDKNGV
jgi:hypothetical protein